MADCMGTSASPALTKLRVLLYVSTPGYDAQLTALLPGFRFVLLDADSGSEPYS